MSIADCDKMTYKGSKVGFARFTSLEVLDIQGCPELILSMVQSDENDESANGRWFLPLSLRYISINASPATLQLCFPENRSCLKSLDVSISARLKYLQLLACKALGRLRIEYCGSLTALEGLQSLDRLRELELSTCPRLPPSLEHLSRQGYELCSRLERLWINQFSFLSPPFCMRLTSLKRLELHRSEEEQTELTDEQDKALQLLPSLQELLLVSCEDLPARLSSFPSLWKLEIFYCPHITRLPEEGLPRSLEELVIHYCSKELADQCRMLATKKLINVKIDGEHVNL
ncbi:hypothetical protein QOZ80_4AG0303530 [Eleusine coracana subsp. coracana]|nr:hypothetical protein QOZ80_4AG0303530 [Eleusine coracana subsp. coracana]